MKITKQKPLRDQTIDEIFEEIPETEWNELITIELIDGEKVTMHKYEYERLIRENHETNMFY